MTALKIIVAIDILFAVLLVADIVRQTINDKHKRK